MDTLEQLGYYFYFNYTVTSLPTVYKDNVDKIKSLPTLKLLSQQYGPASVTWRFDPIILSTITEVRFYLETFERLTCELSGFVERCTFSFVTEYGKVKRNYLQLQQATGITTFDPPIEIKTDLASRLADIAKRYGMTLHFGRSDDLVSERIQKTHCVDGALIERLFYPEGQVIAPGMAVQTPLTCCLSLVS